MKRFINTAFGESASWFYAGAAHVAIPLRCPGVPWCEEEDDGQVHLRRRVMKKPEPHMVATLIEGEPYNILPSVSDTAAQAYLESAEHAGAVRNGLMRADPPDAAATDGAGGDAEDTDDDAEDNGNGETPPPKPGFQTVSVPEDFIVHQFPLRRDLRVQLPLPPVLTKADVSRLHSWLNALTFEEESSE